MEICRFPVVQKPLEPTGGLPLPPRNRVRSNSMSRTLPASPNLEERPSSPTTVAMVTSNNKKAKREAPSSSSSSKGAVGALGAKSNGGSHRCTMKTRAEGTTPTAILPSPSSPSGGTYVPLPLPSIVPLPSHQMVNPFLVCPPVSSVSSPSASSPSLSLSSSSSSSSSSSTTQQRSASPANGGPFFIPVSAATLTDAHLTPPRHPHQIPRSSSASPDPNSASKKASASSSDSKKRPRSASTHAGAVAGSSSPSLTGGEASSPGGHRSKRKRKTPEQLALLEKEFETNPMPNKDVREHLSQHLGLTSRQVQIWFQNKRAKVKNNRGGSSDSSSGQGSPQEASSPEGSPTMISLPLMMSMMDHPVVGAGALHDSSSSSTSPSSSSPMMTTSTYQPAPPSPSSAAAFQQFSSIDSFFEPSYFDLLLDSAPFSSNGATDYLTLTQQQQQTA